MNVMKWEGNNVVKIFFNLFRVYQSGDSAEWRPDIATSLKLIAAVR